MTSFEAGMEGLKLAASLALLFAALRMLRSASLADWRQDLFAIRNDLWDRMRAAGCVDAPGPRALRHSINGAIRFGPRITLPSMFATLMLSPRVSRASEPDPWAEGVPAGQALADLRRVETLYMRAIVRRVLFDTFPGICVGYIFWGAWRAVRVFKGLRSVVDRMAARAKGFLQSLAAESEFAAMEEARLGKRSGVLC